MSYDHIRHYHNWYALLLRLYPRPYYERFGEQMGQTFRDLLRERAGERRELFGYVLWMFVETFIGIIKQNLMYMNLLNNIVIRALLMASVLLLVPITASFFVNGWLWTTSDYVFAWVVFALCSLAFTFVANRSSTMVYKVATGLMVLGAFLLVWVTAAVEIIGDDNPTNVLYGLVLVALIIGSTIVRLKPDGMSNVLFATAFIQAMVPVVGLTLWPPSVFSWSPGVMQVFVLNMFWVVLFVVSGLLFRQANSRA